MTNTARNRIYPVIIVVLLLIIAAMVYKFGVAGSTEMAADGRTAILLQPGERALMLREMRAFVAGLQVMSDALSRDDMKSVAKAARKMGTASAHDVPLTLLGKLPLDFKILAFGVHGGFDAIAADAEKTGTPAHTLGQLSDVLQKCAVCHNRYEVKAATAK